MAQEDVAGSRQRATGRNHRRKDSRRRTVELEKLQKKPNSTSRYIRIDPLCRWEHYMGVDMNVYGPKQNLLAEVKVKNGEDFLLKNDDEFAEYCTAKIAGTVLIP